MFIAALLIIAKKWKLPKCPSADKWIKIIWQICTMNTIQPQKKNVILLFVVIWMELEIILLIEVSQVQKDKSCVTHSYVESKDVDLLKGESMG
jgi:hypothetical protein